jgi:hypothetical protein
MRYRVTSITYEEEGRLINASMCLIEDWLNGALKDGDFGGELDTLMILIFSYYADENGVRDPNPKKSRLSTYKDPLTGRVKKSLALHVSVDAQVLLAATPSEMLSLVSRSIIEYLPDRPVRLPKGLDYGRLVHGIKECMNVFCHNEA